MQNLQISHNINQRPASPCKVKTIATCLLFVLAVQMVAAQTGHAGCVESGAKAAITAGVVAGGLLILDGAFGFPVTTATGGTVPAAALTAVKAAFLAALYGCADASLWDKSSFSSPQPSR